MLDSTALHPVINIGSFMASFNGHCTQETIDLAATANNPESVDMGNGIIVYCEKKAGTGALQILDLSKDAILRIPRVNLVLSGSDEGEDG
jgi:hypothetical protein